MRADTGLTVGDTAVPPLRDYHATRTTKTHCTTSTIKELKHRQYYASSTFSIVIGTDIERSPSILLVTYYGRWYSCIISDKY